MDTYLYIYCILFVSINYKSDLLSVPLIDKYLKFQFVEVSIEIKTREFYFSFSTNSNEHWTRYHIPTGLCSSICKTKSL